MTAPVPSVVMLDALTQCAYRLGLAFANEAERVQGKAMLEACERFDRCFFSVRMAITLQLRLAGPVRPEAVSGRDSTVRDPVEREPSYRHLSGTPVERERERETERASVPLLLNALQGVVTDAASLPAPAPAALLTLRELLATYSSAPATAPTSAPVQAGPPPPRPAGDLRTRLTATTSASVLAAPSLRRATGPPRR